MRSAGIRGFYTHLDSLLVAAWLNGVITQEALDTSNKEEETSEE